jgi:tetratricopeptide (TPR) repeat protein
VRQSRANASTQERPPRITSSDNLLMQAARELQALLKRGFDHLAKGEIDAAAACCKEALQRQPDLVPAHFLVGLVALEAHDRKTAFSAFGSVTQLQKDHAAAWAHLAKLFMSDGQVNRADAALAEARRANSSDPMVHDLLGTVCSQMGEFGEARQWFEKAVAGRPGHPPFLLNLANNLVYHGETGKAGELLRALLAKHPATPQAHWSLAGMRKAGDHTHIEEMQALAETMNQDPRAQAFYYYAIGKEHEDLEEWDAAFSAFEQGARYRRETVAYDEQADRDMFAALERVYTPDWLEAAGEGSDSDAPIFVLGQPRTGTTLVERMISSHSMVHSAGELQQFGLAVRRLSEYRDPRRFSAEFFDVARQLEPQKVGKLYLETSRRMQGDKPRFVDKLPQNYLMLPLILAALPNAKIVHLTRDPRDACFSSFKQLFADAYLHSYDQREMARHHARYWHLMNIWRERFGERFLDVSYEETVRDIEPAARRLLDFLGLPWESAVLDFHKQKAAVSTASAVQVREPAHTRSIGRWRRYEDRLQPMLDELQNAGVGFPAGE